MKDDLKEQIIIMQVKRWLTFEEASLYLGTKKSSIYKLVNRRVIPPSALSKGLDCLAKNIKYIDKEWLDRKLMENRLDCRGECVV